MKSRWIRIRNASVVAIALSCLGVSAQPASAPVPVGQPGKFELLKDWTFGRQRENATIRNRADMDREFFYRYIYDGGKLDRLPTYWSYHRDYPDGDSRSLHVLGPKTLTLKARIPKTGGLRPGGIESGMLRAKFPVSSGMYVEMRAKLTRGIGAWPAFWLNPGVQRDNTFSELPWPPEIDIFEFFNWQGRAETRVMTGYVQTAGKPEKYGHPHDLHSDFERGEYRPGCDFGREFHTFALDWRPDAPIWLLDGKTIKQTHYEWHAPPAHILVTNQIGMTLPGVDVKGMKADETQWDYVIDYIRVFRRLDS